MSTYTEDTRKVTTHRLMEMKLRGEKISMLTAYDFSMATLIDQAGIDVILVGDSASNVMAGNVTTLPITLDQMIYHGKSVVRVIISCGTNDSSNGKPIGDPSELDKPYQEADRKTLYGAINWAVSIIRKYSPDTEIVLLTPIQRSSHSQKLPMFVDAILLAGEKLNCPAINMYEESGITEAVEAKEHKYLYDGLHPNALGQQLMGEVVIKHLIDLYENKQ